MGHTRILHRVNDFNDLKRKLTFVKTDFQVLKLPLYNIKMAGLDYTKILLYKLSVRYLVNQRE